MKQRSIALANYFEKYIRNLMNRSLGDYDASPFVKPFLDTRGIYMEIAFRNSFILGHSLKDERGISTMINKNIKDPQRKLFTQAHELGHHLLDPKLLENNSEMDLLTDKPLATDSKAEVRANVFAAHLLLPDDVLDVVMLEQCSRKRIKRYQHVSYETLRYRLEDYLIRKFQLPRSLSNELVADFMSCPPGKTRGSALARFWRDADTSPANSEQGSLSKSNEKLALSYYDPELLRSRKRKVELQQRAKREADYRDRFLISLSASYIDQQMADCWICESDDEDY